MSSTFPETHLYGSKSLAKKKFPGPLKLLGLVLFAGPKRLLTERLSLKCAVLMVLMCIPSLLICALLTLPAMIFQSPHQQAYYYFSQMLNHDPLVWFVFGLATACTVLSLAMPGVIDETA
jgi:hypothetical protein